MVTRADLVSNRDRSRMQQAFLRVWVDERTQEHQMTHREVWWLVVENTGRRWTRQESIRERCINAQRRARGGLP